ncbi:hypothetical protein PRBEI_2001354200 [Prionailurus iriomotensis]
MLCADDSHLHNENTLRSNTISSFDDFITVHSTAIYK